MNYISVYCIFATIVLMIATVSSQFFFNSFQPNAGADSGFLQQQTRDPRQNTGPVVFPAAPPSSDETSGVIVGASGYGFVPPNSQGVGVKSARYF